MALILAVKNNYRKRTKAQRHNITGNMFKVVKLNATWLSPEDRVYVQKRASAFPYMVDAGSQDPCYWLGEIIDSKD